MFGHRPRLAHPHQGDHPHPLRRQIVLAIAIAALLATIVLLLLPPRAHGNFVYWSNAAPSGGTSIGRAKINGTGVNDNFISGLVHPTGVAVDSKFIYWAETSPSNRIGRANLDGSGVNPSFITTGVTGPGGVAVTSNGIYWVNNPMGPATIGHANIDGSNPVGDFIATGAGSGCGLVADQSFLYWALTFAETIGRAPLGGGTADPNFVNVPDLACGPAVDGSFLYWGTTTGAIGRAPIAGGGADNGFIPGAATGEVGGVAVNPQYIFWGNQGPPAAIGRANINGSSPNPSLVIGPTQPRQLTAAPSNKITINSIAIKKKKGTALIDAKVPGPGQVTLSQTPGTQDVNATAAAVKQIGLTIPQASSFTLPVKPIGKTAKKLNKQIKKQLRKKRRAKAKVKTQAFLTFVPAGVAGVPNTDPIPVTLVKQRTKKK